MVQVALADVLLVVPQVLDIMVVLEIADVAAVVVVVAAVAVVVEINFFKTLLIIYILTSVRIFCL